MQSFERRQLVWAKTDAKYWPGLILGCEEVNGVFQEGIVWIFWFGDHRLSQVKTANLLEFEKLFGEIGAGLGKALGKKDKWSKGVFEAIKVFGQPKTLSWDEQALVLWALDGFKGHGTEKIVADLPSFVAEKLEKISKIRLNLKVTKNEATKAVNVKEEFDKICLSCRTRSFCADHPLFHGKICQGCQEKLVKTMFFYGNDAIQYCCAICGSFGKMIVCSVAICGRSFCDRCFDVLEVRTSKISKKKFWKCFVCASSGDGLLKSRTDWTDRVHKLFNVNYLHQIPKIPQEKRKMTVLSLFDGISSGSVALSKLGMSVDVYYASEIDESAMKVSKCRFANIKHIGDVFKISKDTLTEIGPIDLFLAGSPCNDLSLANPNRKGLYESTGSGNLFFQFFRILMTLKQLHNRPFFWLYENVASMTLKSRETISRFLGCEAVKINSVWTSAQRRERLFWGNCPSLFCDFENEGPELQTYLSADRRAICRDVQTITTKCNSLLQGAGDKFPVFDVGKGCEDVLTTEEIERLFGFDGDFTNIAGLTATDRQALVGKSWSIPAICQLFQFLKYFYLQEGLPTVS